MMEKMVKSGEIKSVDGNYCKWSLKNFQKSLSFREIYVKYLGKNCIAMGISCYRCRYISMNIVHNLILLSFLYRFPVKPKTCDTFLMHL